MIHLYVASPSWRTGEILQKLLKDRKVKFSPADEAKAVVSYGVPLNPNRPALNANASKYNKLEELQTLKQAGVRVPEFWSANVRLETLLSNRPLLARRLKHKGGRDIRYTTSAHWVQNRVKMGWDFFTKFIESKDEYRVWIYRKRHLGTYRKTKVRNAPYKKMVTHFGRGHRNGYAFELVAPVPEKLRPMIDQARAAIAALELDFGAVDVLHGNDGRFYVLEVNTAPGVEGEGRQAIQKLADRIKVWVEKKYPKRGVENEANDA